MDEEQRKKLEEEEKKKKEQQEKAELDTKVRLDEQAILILSAKTLAEKQPELEGTGTKLSSRKDYTYQHFCTFRTEDSAGGHIALTKDIYKIQDMQYILKKMPTSIMSLIVPRIQIYKIFYPSINSPGLSWRVPFDDVSVAAYEKVGKDLIEVTSPIQRNALEEIAEGSGRFHGIGIKNFRYKYVGTNPAEINTNIEAELELYFQDVRDIVKEIKISKGDRNFEGNKAAENFEGSFYYSDLVSDEGRLKSNKLGNILENYNNRYYRIKIIAGYSIPEDGYLLSFLNAAEIEKLKNALRASTVAFYLSPHNHDISFEDSGGITLKIKYNAAMTSVMSSLNVLEIAQKYKEFRDLESKYMEFADKHSKDLEKIRKGCGEARTPTEINKAVEEKNKKFNEDLETKNKDLEESKNIIYSELFNKMVGNGTDVNSGFLYKAIFPKANLGIETNVLSGSAEGSAGANTGATKLTYKNVTKDLKFFKTKYKSEKDPGKDLNNPPTTSGTGSKPQDAIIEASDKSKRSGLEINDNNVEIKFIFLGDLLNTYAQVLRDATNPSERPRLILTNFNYEVLEEVDSKIKYLTHNLNIADIPITLDMLKTFLLDRLVRPRASVYPLLSLIDNIFTDIVAPGMSPTVFDNKSTLNKYIRISNLMLSLPCTVDNKDPLSGDSFDAIFGGKNISTVGSSLALSVTDPSKVTNPLCNYCISYCSNQLPNIIKNNGGSAKKDEENGIYHYFIGIDTGILKKINFTKTNTPFYKEAKNASSQGVGGGGRLREVYNASINMFGNNIYRPGDFLYIEPLVYSGAAAADLQDKLGIGGYYQVIDVETKLSIDNFETDLKCTLYGHIKNGEARALTDC